MDEVFESIFQAQPRTRL